MTKILTISNIHGRLEELTILLQKVSQEHNLHTFDHIVFLGDYIAFGKDSMGVLDMLIKLKKKYPQTVILKGNWEFALYHTLSHKSEFNDEMFKLFSSYNQGNLLKEIRSDKKRMYEYINFIDSMPKYFIKDDYLFTHAGINFEFWDKSYDVNEFLMEYDETHLLWHLDFYKQASLNWFSKVYEGGQKFDNFPYKIVAGQISMDRIKGQTKGTKNNEPFSLDNVYGIDFGGAFEEGQLGAVIFKDDGISSYVVDIGTKQEPKEVNQTREVTMIHNTDNDDLNHTTTEQEEPVQFNEDEYYEFLPYEQFEAPPIDQLDEHQIPDELFSEQNHLEYPPEQVEPDNLDVTLDDHILDRYVDSFEEEEILEIQEEYLSSEEQDDSFGTVELDNLDDLLKQIEFDSQRVYMEGNKPT